MEGILQKERNSKDSFSELPASEARLYTFSAKEQTENLRDSLGESFNVKRGICIDMSKELFYKLITHFL